METAQRHRNHYQVLGLARDASSVDIASAFRDKLEDLKAKADTPEDDIVAVRVAYQVLATPARREEYDATLPQPRGAPGARPARPAPVREEGDAPDWRSRLKLFGVPMAAVAIAVVGYKMKGRPDEPPRDAIVASPVAHVTPGADGRAPVPPSVVEEAGAPQQAAAVSPPAGTALSVEDLFAQVSPSVVTVRVADAGGRLVSHGSGVVVESGGVITNCHVTRNGSVITVKAGSETLPAKVVTADETLDLCALSVPGLAAPAVAVAGTARLRTGQRVYAIGSPHGLELTISEGIVSGLREVNEGRVIQTTAPVSPGSSGGGLFTADGRLAGIVTFQHRLGQNLNFAIPAEWIAEMRARGGRQEAAVTASREPTKASREPTIAEMVVGAWNCFGPISGINGRFDYREDGVVLVRSSNGVTESVPYRLSGRSLQYNLRGRLYSWQIESINEQRKVLFGGPGERIACTRAD